MRTVGGRPAYAAAGSPERPYSEPATYVADSNTAPTFTEIPIPWPKQSDKNAACADWSR